MKDNKTSLSRNYVAKHLHKANNRYAVHANKRESLLTNTISRELDESLFNELKSQGNEGFDLCDFHLADVGCSSISIPNEED